MQPLRGLFALVLSANLLVSCDPGYAQTGPRSAATEHAPHVSRLQQDDRILHALNRFTFGPRPGDLESVRKLGLDRWFEQQLHPETLDNSALNMRLAQFPAMQSAPEDLLQRLPSNAIIRQAIDGKIAIPADGIERAIYQNQRARVEERRQEKQAATASPPNSMGAANSASSAPSTEPMSSAHSMEPAARQKPAATALDAATQQALIAEILRLPPADRLSRLALLSQEEFDSFRRVLKPQQRAALAAGLTPLQAEQLIALENPQRAVVDELVAQRLTRDIASSAQLQEVLTDFWLNHFNVFLHKNDETPYYLVSFERDVIRPRALGKFEDLLQATAHSPAMLLYLDNSSSMGPDSPAAERAARNPARKAKDGLNENYARELMELHTLGVNGGYTQADVTAVARVLTGWTVDRPQRGGGFKFDPNRHEPGDKKVLGKTIHETGEQEGRELLHILAMHPATAQFLSRKLAIRFVGDNPPQPLVHRMARSYLSSGGDISAVLRTLFRSPEFWAPAAYRAKVKTPLEYVVSAARASDAEVTNFQPFANALREMGMPLYGCVPPTGYNWQSATWVSAGALVSRMNFALALASNRLPGITARWIAPQGQLPLADLDAEEQRLARLLVPGGISPTTRSAVLDQFRAQAASPRAVPAATTMPHPVNPSNQEKQDQLLAGLLLGSPEFQRR